MFAMAIVAIAARYIFRKLAVSKGYQAKKAGRYPLIVTAAAMLLSLVLLAIVVMLGSFQPSLRGLLHVGLLVGNWFIMAVVLVILNLAYKKMKAAPDAVIVRRETSRVQCEEV